MVSYEEIKIISGTAGDPLAKKVCEELGVTLAEYDLGRFSDNEIKVQLLESVRNKDVFIINPTNPPAENLLEMIFLAEAVSGSSAGRITLVPTYLGYNRQDRKDRPRVPITSRVIAKMLSIPAVDRVLLFDLHSEPTMGFFDNHIKVDQLYGSSLSIPYIKENILSKDLVIASPDKGGGPRAEAYSKRLGLEDYVLFAKSRPKPNEIAADSIRIIGDVKGKDILFVDDMMDTGGTISADAKKAKEADAKDIYVFATHGLLSKDAVKRLDESPIKEIIITDTVSQPEGKLETKNIKITTLSVAPLLADAIKKIHRGESISSLIL